MDERDRQDLAELKFTTGRTLEIVTELRVASARQDERINSLETNVKWLYGVAAGALMSGLGAVLKVTLGV